MADDQALEPVTVTASPDLEKTKGVYVKPLSTDFFQPPEEGFSEPRWSGTWRELFTRLRSEAEQAGGFTVDIMLAERCATFYTLMLDRDSHGVLPAQEVTRTRVVDGEEVTETVEAQLGWDHIRNQKEAVQVWTQMVGQLRQNMVPDVAAARRTAYIEAVALLMQAISDVADDMPPDYRALFMPMFMNAVKNVDGDALLARLAEEDEAQKKSAKRR